MILTSMAQDKMSPFISRTSGGMLMAVLFALPPASAMQMPHNCSLPIATAKAHSCCRDTDCLKYASRSIWL